MLKLTFFALALSVVVACADRDRPVAADAPRELTLLAACLDGSDQSVAAGLRAEVPHRKLTILSLGTRSPGVSVLDAFIDPQRTVEVNVVVDLATNGVTHIRTRRFLPESHAVASVRSALSSEEASRFDAYPDLPPLDRVVPANLSYSETGRSMLIAVPGDSRTWSFPLNEDDSINWERAYMSIP